MTKKKKTQKNIKFAFKIVLEAHPLAGQQGDDACGWGGSDDIRRRSLAVMLPVP